MDSMSALPWDGQRDGQEMVSALHMLGQALQKSSPLGDQTIYSGLLLTEAATATVVRAAVSLAQEVPRMPL